LMTLSARRNGPPLFSAMAHSPVGSRMRLLVTDVGEPQVKPGQSMKHLEPMDVFSTRPKTSVMRGFLEPHPCIFRLLLKAFPRPVCFSSERVSEFHRCGKCLVL